MAKSKFTTQQVAFVDNYMIHYNSVRAATEAGYKDPKRYGWQLMQLEHIQAEIEKRAKKYSDSRAGLKNRIMEELCSIAFTNLADIGDLTPNGIKIRNEKIPEGALASLAEVSVSETEKSVNTKVRFHNKLQALDLLGKHLGMFKDQEVNVNLTPYVIERRDGSKVELGMK